MVPTGGLHAWHGGLFGHVLTLLNSLTKNHVSATPPIKPIAAPIGIPSGPNSAPISPPANAPARPAANSPACPSGSTKFIGLLWTYSYRLSPTHSLNGSRLNHLKSGR